MPSCFAFASWIAVNILLGVIGVSQTSAPTRHNASLTAFVTAATEPMAPPSPIPFLQYPFRIHFDFPIAAILFKVINVF